MIVMSRIISGAIGLIGAILMLVPAGLTIAAIAPLFGYLGYLPYLPAEVQAIIYVLLVCVILALISSLIALGGAVKVFLRRRGAKILIAGSVLYLIFGIIVPIAVVLAILGPYTQYMGLGLSWRAYLGIVGMILGVIGGVMASRAEVLTAPPPTYVPTPPPPPPR